MDNAAADATNIKHIGRNSDGILRVPRRLDRDNGKDICEIAVYMVEPEFITEQPRKVGIDQANRNANLKRSVS
jgi:hypothetical protein